MAVATLDPQTKTQLAKAFIDQLDPFRTENLFVGIGKISLNQSRTGDGERTDSKDALTRKNMLYAKLLSGNDAAFVIPRVDWDRTGTTTYEEYDPTKDMSSSNSYVYVSDDDVRAVFVCMKSGGERSRFRPELTTEIQRFADGYEWRFVAQVQGELLKFLSDDYVPLKFVPYYEDLSSGGSLVVGDDRLQYLSQYKARNNSRNGQIKEVQVVNSETDPALYTRSVRAGEKQAVRASLSTETFLDDRASGIDDFYNLYAIRFSSGPRAGIVRVITDYDGTARKVTHAAIDVNAGPGDIYEIMPLVVIVGDGVDAEGLAEVDELGRINNVNLVNRGSGYEQVSATTITTLKDGGTNVPTLTSIIFDHRGKDPIFELFANAVKIHVVIPALIPGDQGTNIVRGNDYTEIFLASDFEIGVSYDDSGKPAGYDRSVLTPITMTTIAGGAIPNDTIGAGDYVFGETSNAIAKVFNTNFIPQTTEVDVRMSNLNRKNAFDPGEVIQVLDSSGTTLAVKNRLLKVVADRSDSSTLTIPKSHWAMTHTIGITFDGSNKPTINTAITGASGSVGLIAGVDNLDASAKTCTLNVTQVFGSTSSGTLDFTIDENITTTVGGVTVKSILGPEIDLNSGKMIYIDGITAVSRQDQQEDVIELVFDF